MLRLSRNQQAKELAQRGDNGDLEQDLPPLLEAAAQAARGVDEAELAALITALHRCAQRQLPVLLVGAGLPQLRGRMGKAKSYAERLFEFPEVGPLPPDAAALAITRPAEQEGVRFTPDAVHEIVRHGAGTLAALFMPTWSSRAAASRLRWWGRAVARPSSR